MGDFVDLKRRPTDPEDKVFYKEPQEREYYPVSMYLDKVEMEHLGLTGKKLGDEFVLELRVRVTAVSSNENEDFGSNKSMTLSATAGRVAEEQKRTSDKEMAEAFFPTMRQKG